MNGNGYTFGRDTYERLWRAVKTFLAAPEGHRGAWMFSTLILLLLAINGLNVLNSYVGRDFISAIENRNMGGFVHQAWLFAGVFALSTVAAVIYRYYEERLGLLWREWQTRQVMSSYVDRLAYYRVEAEGQLQNPDQRIAEDIRTFTTSSLSFMLMMLNASITIVAFSGVLWSISPKLFMVAVAYAAGGSLITAWVGKRLIGLNVKQLDKEANLRSELMQLREHAEAIAVMHSEDTQRRRLSLRLAELVVNTRRMIAVNRNLGFFTNGYNYLIQMIPALIVAPLFIHGKVEFGVVTQSAMAFSMLMGAFSLAVTQFQSISTYAAVVGRLGKLFDAIDRAHGPSPGGIELSYRDGPLRFEDLVLRRNDGQLLLDRLNLRVEPGSRVLITGESGQCKRALFEAVAGLHQLGQGRIERPGMEHLLMVPERPYLPKGSVRELLYRPRDDSTLSDSAIWKALNHLQLSSTIRDAGGLDAEHDWNVYVGAREQLRLAIVRVALAAPSLAFLDRLSLALDSCGAEQALQLLSEHGVGYLVIGRPGQYAGHYDATLHIAGDGSWTWTPLSQPRALAPA